MHLIFILFLSLSLSDQEEENDIIAMRKLNSMSKCRSAMELPENLTHIKSHWLHLTCICNQGTNSVPYRGAYHRAVPVSTSALLAFGLSQSCPPPRQLSGSLMMAISMGGLPTLLEVHLHSLTFKEILLSLKFFPLSEQKFEIKVDIHTPIKY